MKNLLAASAALELGAGLGLVCCPSATVWLLVGSPLDAPAALTVARVGGAGLLSLGTACWLSRGDEQSRAARGLIAALMLYDVAAAVILAVARLADGLYGLAIWPAVVLHLLMALWCAACLRGRPPSDRQSSAELDVPPLDERRN